MLRVHILLNVQKRMEMNEGKEWGRKERERMDVLKRVAGRLAVIQ